MDEHPEFWRAFREASRLINVKSLKKKEFVKQAGLGTGFDRLVGKTVMSSIVQTDVSQKI